MVIGAPSQALQIIFEMQSQRSSQKRAVKKYVFSFLFILTPITSSVHNFLTFYRFKLSDLNCSEIAILSSTNHLVTLKATK
jgi:hypothetical protein